MIYNKFKLNKNAQKKNAIITAVTAAVYALFFAVIMAVAADINFGISLLIGILFGVAMSAIMTLAIYAALALIVKKADVASINVRNAVEKKRHIVCQGFAVCEKAAGWLIVTEHTIEFYANFDESGACSFKKLILKSSVKKAEKSLKGEISLSLDDGSVVIFTPLNDEFSDRVTAESSEKDDKAKEATTSEATADEFTEKK